MPQSIRIRHKHTVQHSILLVIFPPNFEDNVRSVSCALLVAIRKHVVILDSEDRFVTIVNHWINPTE